MKSTLQRDSANKIIAGVCSGLGKYFKLDPVFFRLFFLIIMFYGGGGLLLYVLLWVLLPIAERDWGSQQFADTNTNNGNNTDENSDNTNVPIALLLLSAGIMLLVNNIIPGFNLKKLWPIILIVIGVGIILGYNKVKNSEKNKENINE